MGVVVMAKVMESGSTGLRSVRAMLARMLPLQALQNGASPEEAQTSSRPGGRGRGAGNRG